MHYQKLHSFPTRRSSDLKITMGVIVGNRGFFPDHLAKSGREEMLQALQTANIDAVVLGPEQSKYGVIETYEEAKRCADLLDRKSTRLNSSHTVISYAVFC